MDLHQQSFETILHSLYDGLYITDCERRITFWNSAAERITGYSAAEVIGKSCGDNILCHVDASGHNLCKNSCPLSQTILTNSCQQKEVFLHHKAGHSIPISVRVTPMYDSRGELVGAIELFRDLSNRQMTEQRIKQLEELTQLDHLTRLANRAHLEQELNSRMEEQLRTGQPFGILFIDIDHFKQINDRYGHAVGDDFLQMVANTLSANARPFDLFGRWGGEEFLGLIRNIDLEGLRELADRMRSLIAASYLDFSGQPLKVTVSIGATMSTLQDSIARLLKRADTLLYQSKNNGRNRVSVSASLPQITQKHSAQQG